MVMVAEGVKWAYGVTTVPERVNDLLPRTLNSLKLAGFDKPHLFIDGEVNPENYIKRFDLPVTCHFPAVRTFGNWSLALWELYNRYPSYHRFAVFQDDFVTYLNLRAYLDNCKFPTQGYWNLYTFPSAQINIPDTVGWHESIQLGRGAVALVFNRAAISALFQQQFFVDWPQNRIGHRKVDGTVVTAMRNQGFKELVHNPSLVQHTGNDGSTAFPERRQQHPLAESFRGENFDALKLLEN